MQNILKNSVQIIKWLFSIPLIGLIYFYKNLITPFTPAACRFVPSCSAYSLEAITRYGPFKGLALALKRLARCHPWGKFGYDPVNNKVLPKK